MTFASSIKAERRSTLSYFRSIDHGVEVFSRYFGPVARALSMLDADKQAALRKDVAGVFSRYNRATDGTLIFEAQYLEAIITRR